MKWVGLLLAKWRRSTAKLSRKRLTCAPQLEDLEQRIAPVVGNRFELPAVAPGTIVGVYGFGAGGTQSSPMNLGGVVRLVNAGLTGFGTGSLMEDGTDILTAAHVATNPNPNLADTRAQFSLVNPVTGAPMIITDNAGQVLVAPGYIPPVPGVPPNPGTPPGGNDIAIERLTEALPGGGGNGLLVAPYYGPQPGNPNQVGYPIAANFNPLGQVFGIAGYGLTGTGLTGVRRPPPGAPLGPPTLTVGANAFQATGAFLNNNIQKLGLIAGNNAFNGAIAAGQGFTIMYTPPGGGAAVAINNIPVNATAAELEQALINAPAVMNLPQADRLTANNIIVTGGTNWGNPAVTIADPGAAITWFIQFTGNLAATPIANLQIANLPGGIQPSAAVTISRGGLPNPIINSNWLISDFDSFVPVRPQNDALGLLNDQPNLGFGASEIQTVTLGPAPGPNATFQLQFTATANSINQATRSTITVTTAPIPWNAPQNEVQTALMQAANNMAGVPGWPVGLRPLNGNVFVTSAINAAGDTQYSINFFQQLAGTDVNQLVPVNVAAGGTVNVITTRPGVSDSGVAPGDSGGPDFINGVIVGTNEAIRGLPNLPQINTRDGSFGSLSAFMNVASFVGLGAQVPFISSIGAPLFTAAGAPTPAQPLILDMNQQAIGQDGRVDNITISVRTAMVNGVQNLQIAVSDPQLPQSSPYANGMYFNAPISAYTGLTIVGGPDNDTVNILGNLGIPVTFIGQGAAGSGTVNYDDGSNSQATTYTVTAAAAAGGNPATTTLVAGLTAGGGIPQTVIASGFVTFNVDAGSTANIVNVLSTNAGQAVNIFGGRPPRFLWFFGGATTTTTVNVGSSTTPAGNLSSILGPVGVASPPAGSTVNLNIFDTGAAAGQNYTVANNLVSRAGLAGTISYRGVTTLQVNTASASSVAVPSTSATTAIIATGGNVTIGNAANTLNDIQGNVTTIGAALLTINDRGGLAGTSYVSNDNQGMYGATIGTLTVTRPGGNRLGQIGFIVGSVQVIRAGAAAAGGGPPLPGVNFVQANVFPMLLQNVNADDIVNFDLDGPLSSLVSIEGCAGPATVEITEGNVRASLVDFLDATDLIVAGGSFEVDSSTTVKDLHVNSGTLTIDANQTLSVTPGDVALNGGITHIAGGTIRDAGDFTQSGSSVLSIDLAADNPTPVVASGTVTLSGVLQLNSASGFGPSVGTVITLIENDSGTDVSGHFQGLPEGSVIAVNGVTYLLSYQGGSSGQDVVLTVASGPPSGTPVANYISVLMGQGQSVPIDLAGNGQGGNGNPLVAPLVTQPSYGSVVFNPATGLFVYTPTSSNYVGTDSFTYDVTDGTSTSNIATVAISVNPVNQPPTGSNNTITDDENSVYVFNPSDFGFSDPNTPADNFQAVEITTLPSAGTLTDNGSPVAAGQFISISDLLSGGLVFTPALDAWGSSYAAFTFQVEDDGSNAYGGATIDPSPKTMNITVPYVNQPPTGEDNTVTTLENTTYTFQVADFGFSDPNNSPANTFQAVEITTLPTNGILTDNGVPVTAGQFVSVADIAANGLVYTPTEYTSGAPYDSFTFQVQNSGGTANGGVDTDPCPKTMTIDVTFVNQAPVGTNGIVATEENTAYTFSEWDFGFTDPNNPVPNNFIAVEITTLPSNGTLTDNGAAVVAGQFVSVSDIDNGLLVYTPPANTAGIPVDTFTFQVEDDGSTANGGVNLDPSPKTMGIDIVQPSQWVVTSQPGSVTAGSPFSVTVTAEDNQGDVDYAYSGQVTLAVESGPGGSLSGNVTANVVNGVATISGAVLTTAGSYQLQVNDAGDPAPLTPANVWVYVQPGAVAGLEVESGPSTVYVDNAFTETVVATDQYGNVVPYWQWNTSGLQVSMISSPSGATLSGPTSIQPNYWNGTQVSVEGLSLDTAGSYTLSFAGTDTNGNNLTPATASFTVQAVTPTQWVVTSSPGSVTAGSPFSLTVTAEDNQGDVDYAYSGQVTLAVESGPGGSLSGNVTANVVNGVATIPAAVLTTAGSYELQAGDGILQSANVWVYVQAGAATQLVVATPPGTVNVNNAFTLQIEGEDAYGNIVPTWEWNTSSTQLTLTSGPSGGTLSGPTSTWVYNYELYLSGLSVNTPGSYTLSISGTGEYGNSLTPATVSFSAQG